MQPQQWIVMAIICSTLVQIFLHVESSYLDDKIQMLPGQPPVNFQQFGGYITVDEKQQRALFYYFVEAETKPASKPLVLWLNGGLANNDCSSLGLGAFLSNGPFKPIDGSTLRKNDYSWNKEANMLYVESPAGIGFSYSTNKTFYNTVNDEITAQDNLIFLQRWFEKFPQYKNADLFITGEEYIGHYGPQLAQLIIKSGMKFKLKGIAMGNPLLEFATDFNAEDEYYWSHGMISDSSYKLLNSVCNHSRLISESIGATFSKACLDVNTAVNKELDSINEKYVLGDDCVPSDQLKFQNLDHKLKSRSQLLSSRYSKFGAATYQVDQKIDACLPQKIVAYLNKRSVQKALHARLVGVTQWDIDCSSVLKYDLRNFENPTINLVGSLVKSGIRVMAYSGDQDSYIPFTGTRTLINGLAKKLGLKVTVPYRAWFEGKQVAGWTQVYGNILSFAAIRGGAHSAPSTQPERSLTLFRAFLKGEPLPKA